MPTLVVTGHPEIVARLEWLMPTPTILVKPLDYEALARTLRGLLAAAA
jgi:hypothetical protein